MSWTIMKFIMTGMGTYLLSPCDLMCCGLFREQTSRIFTSRLHVLKYFKRCQGVVLANSASRNTTGVYAAAVEPWHHYHTAVNPPVARKSDSTISRTGPTWFEFAQGPANFFMADTRSYRSSNKIDFENKDKTMLGPTQLADLLVFLRRPEPRGVDWKVVAFSVPFTKNWPVNVQDTWGGFLVERQVILEAMWDTAARGIGVIVLSGDRHEFAATKFPPPKDSRWTEEATVYEFSASPLSQFYSPIGTYRQVDDEDVKIKYASSLLSPSCLFQTPRDHLLTKNLQVYQQRVLQVRRNHYREDTRERQEQSLIPPLRGWRRGLEHHGPIA